MKQQHFKVTFLSDIVLQASSNTEGKVDVLDFVPGSNFLGMVARYYGEFDNPFEIFHSGKVRFGDASLLHQGEATYKTPFSYYKPKLGDGKVENHHLIKQFSAGKQLKQIRSGYITKDGKAVELDYNYSQKSAYDTKKRKSKDSQMYGYSAMRKGTTWHFSVSYADDIDIENITEKLLGKKQLGKSRSAQYGSVLIEKADNQQESIEDFEQLENVVLYLNSRWAIIDKNGMPTYQPTVEDLGLSDDTKILWDKCQIRTSSFSPYNGARKTKDYTRLVLEKGSVIVLDKITKEDIQTLKSGVGAYLSEGFGEVLINPTFTKELYPDYQKEDLNISIKEDGEIDNTLITFLQNRDKEQKEIFDVSAKVQTFIKEHKNKFKEVSKSQWGQIRSICHEKETNDDNIAQKVQNFIDHGVAKKRWEKGEKILLQSISNNLQFAQLLAMLMPKQKGEES